MHEGKELIAKIIHYNGPMKDKPFVAENCGALSENLLESKLFGHVKGVFTDAGSDRAGVLRSPQAALFFWMRSRTCPPRCSQRYSGQLKQDRL